MRRAIEIRGAGALFTLVVLLVISACGSSMSSSPKPVRTVSENDARAMAERAATQIIELTGAPVTPQGASSVSSPCSADGNDTSGRYSLLHMYNVQVPLEHQNETLTRVHDTWGDRGYTTEEFALSEVPASPGGRLTGRTADGLGVKLMSTSPPTEITIWVSTPCFQTPTTPAAAGPKVLDIRSVLG